MAHTPPNVFTFEQDFSTAAGEGICLALSTAWLHACKVYGEVNRKDQMGGQFSAGIAFAAFHYGQLHDPDLFFERYALQIEKEVEMQNNPNLSRVAFEVVNYGLYILGVSDGQNQGNGHAMAVRSGVRSIDFFDPNEGQWRFDSANELIAFLPGYLTDTCNDILDEIHVLKLL